MTQTSICAITEGEIYASEQHEPDETENEGDMG